MTMYDSALRSEFNENYRYARDFWDAYSENARIYSLAASGWTWSEAERKNFQKEGREVMELNIMRRPIQFFSGYLRDNIKSIVIGPVEGSDQKTADQLDKVSAYIWDKGHGYRTFLDSADECLKAGISLFGIQKTYKKDFINGDISFYKRTYNSFYLDPTFENLDLSDCSFGITRDLLSKVLAKTLLPFIDPEVIDDIQTSFRDDKFISYHPQFTQFTRQRDVLAYDQYYKKITKRREFLVDLKSSFSRDITDESAEDKQKLKIGLRRLREMREQAQYLDLDDTQIPNVEVQFHDREFVELNIMLNGIPVYCGEDKTGINTTFPFVALLCYFEPSIWDPRQRIQGIASTQYSAQRNFNKRHMKIVDIMDTLVSTGYKYLLGSVPDVSDLQQSGQNRIIGIDPDNAPQGLDSVQQLNGENAALGPLMEYQRIMDELTLTLANVNESVLGVDEGGNTQVSGRLAQVRMANGLRSNRKVFDNLEFSQQLAGGLVLEAIQKNYPPEKVMRIINEEPTQQFYDNEFEQYDAVIKQGVITQTQRDAYYFELVNLKRDGIVDVPQSEIVDNLPMAGQSDLKEAIEAQMAQQAEQQKKIDAQEQLAMEIRNANKESQLALAQERRARVLADIGLSEERASESEENRAQAALARAKTITEIASMQDERILKVLEFVNMLEAQEKMDQEQIKDGIDAHANRINTDTQGSAENMQAQQAQQMQQELLNNMQQGGQNGLR